MVHRKHSIKVILWLSFTTSDTTPYTRPLLSKWQLLESVAILREPEVHRREIIFFEKTNVQGRGWQTDGFRSAGPRQSMLDGLTIKSGCPTLRGLP